MDSSSLPAPPPPSSPRDDEATARLLITAILLLVVIIIVVASLCLRVRQTWHNNKESRRLTKRVAWLRDLLQLLPPSAPTPAPASEEEEKGGASATTSTTAQGVRTVLARRIEATVSKVDRLVSSASVSMSRCCCLLGFARSYELARRLERANKDVDEVYTHLLPIVTQIDASHRVEQVLVGVMQQQEQGGHDGNLAANKNNHSDAQRPARPNGSNEFDWQPLLSENNDYQASTAFCLRGKSFNEDRNHHQCTIRTALSMLGTSPKSRKGVPRNLGSTKAAPATVAAAGGGGGVVTDG